MEIGSGTIWHNTEPSSPLISSLDAWLSRNQEAKEPAWQLVALLVKMNHLHWVVNGEQIHLGSSAVAYSRRACGRFVTLTLKQQGRELCVDSLRGEAEHVGKSQSLLPPPYSNTTELLDLTSSSSTSQSAGVALIPSTLFRLTHSAHYTPTSADTGRSSVNPIIVFVSFLWGEVFRFEFLENPLILWVSLHPMC